jgi:hypothetical protein
MKLLCLLVIALPLTAATETAVVTVPDAQAAGLATLMEAWIQGQVNADGTLKYPGATQILRRQEVFNAILRDGVRNVVRQACSQFPASCPSAIKTQQDAALTADADKSTAINGIVQ